MSFIFSAVGTTASTFSGDSKLLGLTRAEVGLIYPCDADTLKTILWPLFFFQVRPLCGPILDNEEQLFGYEVIVERKVWLLGENLKNFPTSLFFQSCLCYSQFVVFCNIHKYKNNMLGWCQQKIGLNCLRYENTLVLKKLSFESFFQTLLFTQTQHQVNLTRSWVMTLHFPLLDYQSLSTTISPHLRQLC